MSKYDLSILIPARNEMFISNTVEDILKNKRGKTEVIVGLDGEWAEPGIADHPDVRIVYVSESRGQRGMTNTLARLSKAKYIAKCDAHCAYDEGFDVKLMNAMQGHDDWTVVPIMRNLHAFDWKCMKCGKKTYQGPTPGTRGAKFSVCEDCGANNFKRKILWYPKPSPQSTAYCFDPEPHFQYFGSFKKRPEGQGDITPTMSLQGSFFMLTREKYWELDICDERFGSWGSQGIEVAMKTRLSGGQVMCVQTTWYAHMFRTQGGDFSFPYEQRQSKVIEAKKHANNLFFGNRWKKQIYPVSKVVDEFWPIEHWSEQQRADLKKRELTTKRSGIYSITSKATGRVYIGSAINIANRVFEHTRKFQQGKHANVHMQRVCDKYGIDDLVFGVLYFCPVEDLIKHEQRFIDEYKEKLGWEQMLNISPTAGSTLGKPHSDETKLKISLAKVGTAAWNKGLTKEIDPRIKKYAEAQIGQTHWTEHPRGMLGKQHTSEARKQISDSAKASSKKRPRNENGQFI